MDSSPNEKAAPTAQEGLRHSAPYFMTILFLISVVNFLDRQVLSIVQEDVKIELSLSDSQLGLLALAFGLFHAGFALPVGRMADRSSRKSVLVGCLAVWSSITLFTGFVTNFVQLMVMRMGVAMGEAGVTPTSYSMISDKFPIQRRATAVAIYSAGIPVGLMLSLFLGGLIAREFGWRMTFVLFGIPGLILAGLLAYTVAEPRKGGSDGIKEVRQTRFFEALIELVRIRTYVFILIATTVHSIVGYGILHWMPSYYIRAFELDKATVGISMGPVIGIAGLVGAVGAAVLADRLSRRDLRWYPWILGSVMIAGFPFLIGSLLAGSFVLSLVLFGLFILITNSALGLTNASLQSTSPVQSRAMAAGLKTLCLSFIGYGLGGALIGLLSDALSGDGAGDAAGLSRALIVVSILLPVSGALYLLSAPSFRGDVEAAKALSEAAPT